MLLVSTPHIRLCLWVSICICMSICMCIYPVFIERDYTEKPSFDVSFFLKRLNKEGIEATTADPPRASAAHSALTQTTADASPPSHSVWTLSLDTATASRQVHREGEQRQKSFLFSPRTITSFHCQSYAMIQSESGEEQNRKCYHQMREKGLQYSFMDTYLHLYVS